MLDYIVFLSCLEFAVLNSAYHDIIFKPKQVICLEGIFLQNDVLCVLPTGYGKSLIFHLAPMLLFAKSELGSDMFLSWKLERKIALEAINTIVIVVSPLNSLMINQISRLSLSGIQASMLSVKKCPELSDESEENMDIDLKLCEEDKLRNGSYHIVFCHPESFISTKYGREILMSKIYQDNVVAIVIDESHCILDW